MEKETNKNMPARRHRLDLNEPAELAIYEAMQAVEKMPGDIRLTHAGIRLMEAKSLVADFIDNVPFEQSTRNEAITSKLVEQLQIVLSALKKLSDDDFVSSGGLWAKHFVPKRFSEEIRNTETLLKKYENKEG